MTDLLISTKTAPHFTWGNSCDGWWLKQTGSFTVVSELMPPGSTEVKHYHNQVEQFFYVLEGTLVMELDNITYTLHQHEGITIKAGIAHKAVNNSKTSVRFLVISCPDSHSDRVNL
jgi:uncharacterized cupin superfamily protein